MLPGACLECPSFIPPNVIDETYHTYEEQVVLIESAQGKTHTMALAPRFTGQAYSAKVSPRAVHTIELCE